MMMLLLGWVGLALADIELDYQPPLFHVQDIPPVGREDMIWGQGVPYYLCYRYPRPDYWVERGREIISRWWNKS